MEKNTPTIQATPPCELMLLPLSDFCAMNACRSYRFAAFLLQQAFVAKAVTLIRSLPGTWDTLAGNQGNLEKFI